MKRLSGIVCLAWLASLAGGCATSYHSTSTTGGYSDTQLSPDEFRVVFAGNGYTTYDQARDFALLRACELTVQHGFTFFTITEESPLRLDPLGRGLPGKRLQIRCFHQRPEMGESFNAVDLQQTLRTKYGMT